MWAVDTSWLYALFHAEDAHHAAAVREAGEPASLLLNPVILAEFLDLVRERYDHATALDAYADLVATPTVRFVAASKAPVLSRILAGHTKLSWVDGAAIATALDEGVGLRTFDVAQLKAFKAMR